MLPVFVFGIDFIPSFPQDNAMATSSAVVLSRTKKQKLHNLLEEYTAGNWGLKRCPTTAGCLFCDRYYDTSYLLQFRNLYVSGINSNTLIKLLDRESPIVGAQLDQHAFRQSWHHRKTKFGKLEVSHDFVLDMILRRIAETAGYASPNSADKMLTLLTDVKGMRKTSATVQTNVSITWEKVVSQRSSDPNGDAVITLDDDDFFSDREGQGYEDEAD